MWNLRSDNANPSGVFFATVSHPSQHMLEIDEDLFAANRLAATALAHRHDLIAAGLVRVVKFFV
jgi:hypothetical protein